MKLFIDTWGWVELNNKHSLRYQEVKNFYQDFLRQKGRVYTSDYVLDETITLLFKRLPYKIADESLKWIEQAVIAHTVRFERISEQRFNRTIELRRKYRDKPRISFTDLTSMVVMSELGITDVMTEDDHFLQVGMGFNKAP